MAQEPTYKEVAIPAWQIIKEAIVEQIFITDYYFLKASENPKWENKFKTNVKKLYFQIREHLKPEKRRKTLALIAKNQWEIAFLSLKQDIYDLGITKITIETEELPEGHEAIFGHPSLYSLANKLPSLKKDD